MGKIVELNEKAQRFLISAKKAYRIPELKATIFATSDVEFARKKAKLLARNQMYNVGGLSKLNVK